MSNLQEHFVPYALAVKLKELGFDENCIGGYRDYNGIKLMTRLPNNTFPIIDSLGYGKYCKQNEHVVKAPLWQQAEDYFSEKHKINNFVHRYITGQWCFEIFRDDFSDCWEMYFPTKQEARQACLEKLIELVEQK